MTAAWLDANVVLRFLRRDHPTLAARARAIFAAAAAGERELRLSSLIVAEVVWTLISFYGLPRAEVCDRVAELIGLAGIVPEERDHVLATLRVMKEQNVDFADAYLAERARAAGEPVCSFDRDFEGLGVDVRS